MHNMLWTSECRLRRSVNLGVRRSVGFVAGADVDFMVGGVRHVLLSETMYLIHRPRNLNLFLKLFRLA